MTIATRWIVRAGAAALVGLFVFSSVVPARADDDRGRRGWREHEWREHHEWRPYYYGPQVYITAPPAYVAPPPVYAPPPVVYAPPPAAVYAPPPAPAVNFVFPLRF